MNHIKIDKLRIRLKNVAPEKVQEALPGAWSHLRKMISRQSFLQNKGARSFSSVGAGKIDLRQNKSGSLSVQIAENIYRTISAPAENKEGR